MKSNKEVRNADHPENELPRDTDPLTKEHLIRDLFRLDGKLALVTGASSGIGTALVKALAAAGATVVFNGRRADMVEAAMKNYTAEGIDATGYVFDVTDEKSVNVFIKKITEEIGPIDILVNNAGITKRVPALDMSTEDFRVIIDIDLVGPFIMSKAVAPGMIKKGGGKIINICSLMSELGRETITAYASAKGGLKMLTRNLACEWAAYNIQVNGIGPGYIATPLTASLREEGNPFNTFITGRTPAGRWGIPEDLDGPVIFLASKASDFVNGHILYVDGGILAYLGKQPG
jgi:gluconate 5-dehydrogenase